MQTKALLTSAALVGSALAFPLENLLGRQLGYGSTATSVSVAHASYVPTPTFSGYEGVQASYAPNVAYGLGPAISGHPASVSGLPEIPITGGDEVSDGYGIVYPDQTSLVLCPVSRRVKLTTNLHGAYTVQEFTLACPNNGASYEDLPTKTGPAIKIHGGNLCTSNIAQYYLWPSRMYQNLWLAFGSIAATVPDSENCQLVDGPQGQVARCSFNSQGIDYASIFASYEAHASHVPYASGTPYDIARITVAAQASYTPHASYVAAPVTTTPAYSQPTAVAY